MASTFRFYSRRGPPRFPLIDIDGVVGAAFVSGDGTIDPASLGNGLAIRARRLGARICEGVTGDRVRAQGAPG
jgi:4-methylaminobutanoate oxidase (formaldehyde-forming)